MYHIMPTDKTSSAEAKAQEISTKESHSEIPGSWYQLSDLAASYVACFTIIQDFRTNRLHVPMCI